MKPSLPFKLYAGLVCCVLLVLAISAFSYRRIKQQIEDANLVNHSYQVINSSQSVRNLLLRTETNKLAYRSTGEKRFLTLIDDLRGRNTQVLDSLVALTADNPKQNDLARQIRRDVNNFQLLSLEGAEESLTREQTIELIDKEDLAFSIVNQRIDFFQKNERALLQQRKIETDYWGVITVRIIVIGLLVVLILVIALCYRFHQELSGRIVAQRKLRETIRQIEYLHQETQEKNWQLEGVSQINNKLQEHPHNVEALAQASIEIIADYLKVPTGIFYVFNDEKNILEPLGSVAVPKSKRQRLKLGESLSGQAALRQEISVIEDVPASFWNIEAGLGKAEVGSIIYLPLFDVKGLKGLIELASIEQAITSKVEFLKLIADNVTRAVANCLAHNKMEILLEQINEQKEELIAQKESLADSHERIKIQTEELKVSEEELRVQQEELKQINAELETQNEVLEQAREAIMIQKEELEKSNNYKSEFLANMSHELRTPLNSILVLAKLMADDAAGNLNEKQKEYSKIIHKSGSDLLDLINDILDLSKIEAGKLHIDFQKVPIREIIGNMHALFDMIAKERAIQFNIQCSPALPETIVSNQQRIEQILKNLLANAFKFTPSAGKVDLVLALEDVNDKKMLCFQVKDTGIGIPKDKQEAVFNAFQQIDGAINRKYTGTGLGLSISSELVEKLHGFIRLQSEPHKGSIFSVYLPLNLASESAYSFIGEANQHSDNSLPISLPTLVKERDALADDRHRLKEDGKSMLIIEDDPVFSDVLMDFARGQGYKVIVALTGDEGIYCIKKYKPSAIILDMHLPVLNGENVLRYINEHEELHQIPVHIISSQDDPGLNVGDIIGYTVKSIAFEEMDTLLKLFDNDERRTDKKRILLVDKANKVGSGVREVLKNYRNAEVDHVTGSEHPQEVYDIILYYLDTHPDEVLKQLTVLKKSLKANESSIIIFIDRDIGKKEEILLKRFTDTLIRLSIKSDERLVDELNHYLSQKTTDKQQIEPVSKAEIEQLLRGQIILVADDDMRNIFTISSLMEENGANVVIANNGQEVLDILEQYDTIDLILMDIMMPVLDGLETMITIRRSAKFKELPIIAITAKAMAGDQEKCMKAGASDYVTKPIDADKLLNLMKIWLSIS